MLFTTQKLKGWVILISFLAVLLSGCFTEDVSTTDPVIPKSSLEKFSNPEDPFPLENLRINPITLKMLANLRAATAKFHDLAVAEAEGYAPVSPCVSHPDLGAMGFHYANFGYVDGTYDPTQPEALLYEMDEEGDMHLVGVEFIVVTAAWDGEELPHFGSQIFDTAFAPTPLPFDNYQLHVWVWRHNPNGIFTKFNPEVSCN